MRPRKSSPASGRRQRRKTPLLAIAAPAPPRPVCLAASEPRWPAHLDATLPLVVSALNCARLELGLAVVVLARRVDRAVVCAHFVVDLLAAGVTDVYGEGFGEPEFERYFDDLDERVPLESIAPEAASRLVWDGVALGEKNRVVQPESLEYWARLLPPPTPGVPAASAVAAGDPRRLFAPGPTPLAVAEVLALRPRLEGVWLGEDDEIRCVVRVESPSEH